MKRRGVFTVVFAAAAGLLLLGTTCKLANKAPAVPTLSGPTTGVAGVAISFKAASTDPESDSLQFQLDWGAGAAPAWSAFVASGDTVTVTNTYSDSGVFVVKARSKDTNGKESDWSAGYSLDVIPAAPAYPDTVVAAVWLPWQVTGSGMSPDGSLIGVGPYETSDSLLLFRTSDRSTATLIQASNYVSDIALSSDNRYAYVSSHRAGHLVRVDLSTGSTTSSSRQYGNCLALASPGDSLIFADDGSKVLKMNSTNLTIEDSVILPATVNGITASGSGAALYVCTNTGLGVVDAASCSLARFATTPNYLWNSLLSPDGQLLYATGAADSGVTVFHTSDLTIVNRANLHFGNLGPIGISPNGASLYVDMPVGLYVFDTRTMALIDSIAIDDMWGDILVHPGGDSLYYVGYRTLYVIGKRH